MSSKYHTMNCLKLSQLRAAYPQTLLLRRAVVCRNEARLLRTEAARMTANTRGQWDRERLAEMCEEKAEMLVIEYQKGR